MQVSPKSRLVAFIGGSITEMEGYRPMVCDILRRRFSQTNFTFTNAGIASTCSTTGAFRLGRDVLSKGPVDLLFVEFAVNDDQDAAHARRQCIRGIEGVIRQVRRHNPEADVVITHFINPSMLETLTAGGVPVSIAAHEEVARHYRISTIHLAQEVTDRIASGTLTWEHYGGTHPKQPGNALCAEMIDLYHRFSSNLHYPRTVIFDADLEPCEHTLTLRVSAESNARSAGHAVRILHFVAN